jgi:hypothetical protein
MTWQESLRQLDVRLANGDISANEYRRTRDEILAEASSNSAADSKQDLWVPVQTTDAATANATEAATEAATDAATVDTTANAGADSQQDAGETTIVVKRNQVEEDTQDRACPACGRTRTRWHPSRGTRSSPRRRRRRAA